MFQKLVMILRNWFYRDDIIKFDKEYEELTKGEQFPDEKKISKQFDFVLKSFSGEKISTEFSSHENDAVEMAGLDNSTDF